MKERLTGAIIVVAALVLLVPELLTGPESKHASAPAGSEGAQLRSYTIDLHDDANRQPPSSAPAVAATDDPVAQATPEPEVESPPVANVTPPVDDATRASGKPMGSGADTSAAAPDTPPSAVKPGAATPPSADDDKPRSAFGPNAAVRPPPEKSASTGKSGAVSSSDAAKADAARAAAAKSEALKAEAAKADAARAEAAKAEAAKALAAKNEAARAAATKPESAKPPPKAEAIGAGSKGWAVQLGVFGSRDNAERLAKQVRGGGFTVLVNESSGKDGKKLYWVRVGPEAEQSAANALSAKLKAAGHPDARVVAYP